MGYPKSKARESSRRRSRSAWALARRQHSVVAHRQLLALGFSPQAVRHRLANGRLHRVHRGVYAVGRPDLSREGRWMAAILCCGEGAMLSHESAAALWGLGPVDPRPIEVTIRRRGRHRRAGLRVRSRPALPATDVTSSRRIPVTTPARTLLDQAIQLGRLDLERQVNEADARDRIDPESLRAYLDGRTGEPGVRPLRVLLDRATFRLSDSRLEQLFRPLALAAGLPQPQTKQRLNSFEVDFYWPDLGLVVEADSLRHHRTALKQKRDLLRDQTHVSRGLVALRVSHHQVRYEPAYVVSLLRATATRLAPSAARRRARS